MLYSDKKILITGANGFIGRHLSSYLINELNCSKIYGLIRPEDKTDIQNPRGYTEVLGNIRDKNEVAEIFKSIRPDIIFHLAADIRPSRSIEDMEDMLSTNVQGTMNLIYAIERNSIRLDSFVNMGSCEEYGYNKPPFTEDMLPSPISVYSGTKAAAGMLCKMAYNLYNIPIVTARPSLIYGPGQSERFFIIQAIKKLMNNDTFDMTPGEQKRDFIYVYDVIKGLVALSGSREAAGEFINLSSGTQYMLKDVVNIISNILGSSSNINFGAIPYRESEIMDFSCNNSRIREITGWVPSVSLEEGLMCLIKHIKGEIRI